MRRLITKLKNKEDVVMQCYSEEQRKGLLQLLQ